MKRNNLVKGPKHFSVETSKEIYCWNCKKKIKWNIILGFVYYNGIKPCLECSICGETIPAFSIKTYEETGLAPIPM